MIFNDVSATVGIIVGDEIFWRMQEFDFARIQSNLPKSNRFYPYFASILPKSYLICPNLMNFAPPKFFARGCSCIPSSFYAALTFCTALTFYTALTFCTALTAS